MEIYMNQTEKVLSFLKSGRNLNPNQARSMFGVRNLRARVSDLRSEGYAVYTNTRRGKTTYRLGTPSRSMVAAAYAAIGTKAFQ